jgi:hypothetical protein
MAQMMAFMTAMKMMLDMQPKPAAVVPGMDSAMVAMLESMRSQNATIQATLAAETARRETAEVYSKRLFEVDTARQEAVNKMAIATAGLKPEEQAQVKTINALETASAKIMDNMDKRQDRFERTVIPLLRQTLAQAPNQVQTPIVAASQAELEELARRGQAGHG